jgi:transposase
LRRVWPEKLAGLALGRLVFIDESGAKTNMTRRYGRTFDGERLVDATPHGHWSTTTMISAVRLTGQVAAMVIEGATDAAVFQAYVEQVLRPSLRSGDIVILDNLSSHKTAGVLAALDASGAEVWFLPPYSPDLNPIEKMWSKIKAYLRKVEARTKEALLEAIAAALETITASDALGWFMSCGYTQA